MPEDAASDTCGHRRSDIPVRHEPRQTGTSVPPSHEDAPLSQRPAPPVDDDLLRLAASLCARYSDAPAGEDVVVVVEGDTSRELTVPPAEPAAASALLV